jgi:hypothetical protein
VRHSLTQQVNKQPLPRWPTLALFATLRTSIRSIRLRPPPRRSLRERGWRCLAGISGTSGCFRCWNDCSAQCGSRRRDFRSRSFSTWVFCFFLDGTRFSLVRFDELKEENGYAGAIEVDPEAMASFHQIKRFPRRWSGHVLRVLFGPDLAVSQAGSAGVSLAALANVFACPGSGGCDSRHGHDGNG